jgi:CRP-like cAMP-binding protein
LQALIEKVQVRQYEEGGRIITQGEPGDALYVLVEGEAIVYREGEIRVEVNRMSEGAFFGEIALLTSAQRTTTVEAAADTTVIEISREVIGDLINEQPGVLKVLLRFFRDRLINTLIESSVLFASYTRKQREELTGHFAFIEAESDTVFIREGQESDGLYILLSGELDLGHPVEQVGTGYLFGATSLLPGESEAHTISAKTKCWLLRMARQTFWEVIAKHPQVLAFVNELAARRRQQSEDGEGASEA